MLRFALPAAFALLLPACGSSSAVSCAVDHNGVEIVCADYSFSGDSQGQDVTTLEQNACASELGTVVDSCPTSNTLGTCTSTEHGSEDALTIVRHFYAVGGMNAASAQVACASLDENSVGIIATWSGS